jgi:hypothetical protein
MTIATTTFKDVQLVKAGTWGGMTGRSTITAEDLADAVAAYADPEIDRGVLKIGHDGDLNLGTGQPALGWIENLKLSADKQTLIGDLTDIPSKLAAIIPRAFRRRSVEMTLGATTPSGKKYRAALTGLALLGAKAPAVKGLDDILALYAAEGEPLEGGSVVAFAVEGGTDTAPVPHDGTAERDGGPDGTPDERTADVALLDELKKTLGLSEDATEADVTAAVAKAKADAAPAGEKTPEEIAAEEAAAAEAEEAAKAAAAKPAEGVELGEGDFVKVSKVVFGEMQSQLASLTETAAVDRKAKALDSAIAAGKISPAERVAFAATLDANEAAGIALLNSLAPRVAVIELGADHAPNADAAADAELLAAAEAAGI